MKPVKIEEKLAVNKFDIDEEKHIRINQETCDRCDTHVCVFTCPSDCFKFTQEHLTFSFEGCLECGSCRIVCDEAAIEWTLPRGGFGICYQYG